MPPDEALDLQCSLFLTIEYFLAFQTSAKTLYLYYSISLEQDIPFHKPTAAIPLE
jgi:hypothetical protein